MPGGANPTPVQTPSGASPSVVNNTGFVATFQQPFNSITVGLNVGS